MVTTKDYLTQLQTDKENLVNNLVEKGVEATADETFTSLVPKVLDIESGGGTAGEVYSPEYITFMNYTGTSLENALKNIDVSKITTFSHLFDTCKQLLSLDFTNFDTTNVSDLSYMFKECSALKSITNFKVGPNNTNLTNMFYNCNKLETLDVSDWDTSNVTNMSTLFWRCYALTSLDVSKWKTSNVTSFGSAFQQLSKITELDVSNFDTSKSTAFGYMFYGTPVTNLDMSKWDTSKGKSFKYMFYQGKMSEYNLSNFSFANATDLSYMFQNAAASNIIITSDIPLVTDLGHAFDGCSNLETIDLSSFVGGKNCELDFMFKGCKNLKEVNLSNLRCYGNTTVASMFYECTSLEKIDMRSYDFTKITTSSYKNSTLFGVPTTCQIIVMNDDCKSWFATNFANYTNVVTVAELEALENV